MKEKATIEGSSGLSHIYTPGKGDREAISKYRGRFRRYSNEALIEAYNTLNGLYGVHQQVLYIIALHQEFLKRFNQSPFKSNQDNLLNLGSQIIYDKSLESFSFVEHN